MLRSSSDHSKPLINHESNRESGYKVLTTDLLIIPTPGTPKKLGLKDINDDIIINGVFSFLSYKDSAQFVLTSRKYNELYRGYLSMIPQAISLRRDLKWMNTAGEMLRTGSPHLTFCKDIEDHCCENTVFYSASGAGLAGAGGAGYGGYAACQYLGTFTNCGCCPGSALYCGECVTPQAGCLAETACCTYWNASPGFSCILMSCVSGLAWGGAILSLGAAIFCCVRPFCRTDAETLSGWELDSELHRHFTSPLGRTVCDAIDLQVPPSKVLPERLESLRDEVSIAFRRYRSIFHENAEKYVRSKQKQDTAKSIGENKRSPLTPYSP